ncbi:MAG: hypothetical protein AAF799_38155 [Myxococcota bacterium]
MTTPSFTPAPYYCEENVWQMCADPLVQGQPRAAIFISNSSRTVAVMHQRAAPAPQQPVVWDYHVVMAARGPTGWMIWDVDSTLGMPVPMSIYLRQSLAFPAGFEAPFTARCRVISAARYRATLCTDRSHMLDEQGQARAPLPSWPAIGQGTNLMRFVDLDQAFEGEVVELPALPGALERVPAADEAPNEP